MQNVEYFCANCSGLSLNMICLNVFKTSEEILKNLTGNNIAWAPSYHKVTIHAAIFFDTTYYHYEKNCCWKCDKHKHDFT